MTTGGFIVMLSSIVAITALFGWCIFKIITAPDSGGEMHGFESETPDKYLEAVSKTLSSRQA